MKFWEYHCKLCFCNFGLEDAQGPCFDCVVNWSGTCVISFYFWCSESLAPKMTQNSQFTHHSLCQLLYVVFQLYPAFMNHFVLIRKQAAVEKSSMTPNRCLLWAYLI